MVGVYKRRRTSYGRRSDSFGKYLARRSKVRRAAFRRRPASRMQRAIKSAVLGLAERKKVQIEVCKNQVLQHNELYVIENNIFATVVGTGDNQRIGSKIFAKYIKFKMHFENQQYRPVASYLILVLRNKNNPSANISTGDNIFKGVTTSKNLDYIDYDKFQVLYSKRLMVRDGNQGGAAAMGTSWNPGIDGVSGSSTDPRGYVNVQRYYNFKIRMNKTLEYLTGNTPEYQNYHLAIIPYANYSATTSGDIYPVGHVSCVSEFVFKDP